MPRYRDIRVIIAIYLAADIDPENAHTIRMPPVGTGTTWTACAISPGSPMHNNMGHESAD
jgi:hypothetical protein